MKIDELANALEDAFPHINFKDGPASSEDSRGGRYFTYTLGKVKTEGASNAIVYNLEEPELVRLFFLDLHDVIAKRQPKFVEWRRKPLSSEHEGGAIVSCRFSMRMSP